MGYNAYQPLRRPPRATGSGAVAGPGFGSGSGFTPPGAPVPPPPPPPPPRRRRGRGLVILICGAMFAALCVVVATDFALRGHPTSAKAADVPSIVDSPVLPPTSAPQASGPVRAPVHPKTLISVDGNDNGITPQFSTGADWYLRYNYECPAGAADGGNMKVFVYSVTDSGTLLVNEHDEAGTDTLPEHGSAGRRYLRIASDCSWTVTVIG